MRIGYYVQPVIHHETGTQEIDRWRTRLLHSAHPDYRRLYVFDSPDKIARGGMGNEHENQHSKACDTAEKRDSKSTAHAHHCFPVAGDECFDLALARVKHSRPSDPSSVHGTSLPKTHRASCNHPDFGGESLLWKPYPAPPRRLHFLPASTSCSFYLYLSPTWSS